MNHLCQTKSNCIPGNQFLGQDTPFANLSSELPDIDTFLGCNFGWDLNIPRLGCGFTDLSALGCCRAPTQPQADSCAANTQLSNLISTWNCPPPPPPPPPCLDCGPGGGGTIPLPTVPTTHGPPPQTFFNNTVSCPFTCPDGNLFVWTVFAGQFEALNQATADAIAKSFACQQALRFYICLGSLTTAACLGVQYSSTANFTGGLAPIAANLIGTLPPGLFMTQDPQGKSFTVSGTPSAAGNFQFSVMAVDTNGNFMTKQYTINVLGITNINALPPAAEMRAYSFQLTAAGGTSPYTFSQLTGNMPGITMSSSGLLSGTPNYVTAGSYPFTVTVTDANGNACLQNGTLKVTLAPGPDWTKLAWSSYVFNQAGNNTASGGASSNVTFGQLKKDSGAFFPSIDPVAAAGVHYAGPQVTSRIILTVGGVTGFNSMTTRVFQSGFGQVGGYSQGMANGTFNFDFTVFATAGSDFTLDDAAAGWAILTGVGTPGTISFTWAIVNV